MNQKRITRTVTEAERVLWATTMSNVTRGGAQRGYSARCYQKNIERTMDLEANHAPNASVEKNLSPAQEALENRLYLPALPEIEVGKNGGTDRRTADRLRRGRLAIDMRLDLHGLSLEKAYQKVVGFLPAAQSAGARCVLVITGKGSRAPKGLGRLRVAVPRWLNEPALRSIVLSASHARPKDGGEGALYILIRKPKAQRP